ncbi:hypothetical protein NDU88_005539 [Pleurodeles waltl]|uniref:Uncharacterized protein n=1 Tax=Pleurodeles waltl TaxID=8319 RepID=A0AAV7MY85_PLEWA|nr:hypothetical protein NDU88_005539 [Pleurodeles waltl]
MPLPERLPAHGEAQMMVSEVPGVTAGCLILRVFEEQESPSESVSQSFSPVSLDKGLDPPPLKDATAPIIFSLSYCVSNLEATLVPTQRFLDRSRSWNGRLFHLVLSQAEWGLAIQPIPYHMEPVEEECTASVAIL